jgi:CelD/BcsL family acetyltransferase involved in cellulose biosynthesis
MAAYARFLAAQPQAGVFHDPRWLAAVAQGSGHASHLLLAEQGGAIVATLPLHAVSSPLFGRALVSTGFAVGGGVVGDASAAPALLAAAQDLAQRLRSPTIELRGGVPQGPGWHVKQDSHAGFVCALAADDAAQLQAVPRKQRAELRKGLANGWRCAPAAARRIAPGTIASIANPCATWAPRCFRAACSPTCSMPLARMPIS